MLLVRTRRGRQGIYGQTTFLRQKEPDSELYPLQFGLKASAFDPLYGLEFRV